MCGLGGFYCLRDKRPDKESITNMFSSLESRGRDASGFAFVKDSQLVVSKAPVRSSLFVKTDDWKGLKLPKIMILHTRAATQGTAKNNQNNHPLFDKRSGICIVHNGIIYNDKDIFGKSQKRDAEVDSEAILAVLGAKGKTEKVKRVFDRLEGSYAFAAINRDEPASLLLVKKDNPIDLYYDTKSDIIYFCSERRIMQEGLGIKSTSARGFNLGEGNYHFYEMKNNHALTLGIDGVESYEHYHPRKFGYFENELKYRSRSDEMLVECPYCLGSTIYHISKLFNKCECCGQDLNEEDLYV